MICTWMDCLDDAIHKQLDKNNREWANLCDKHNKMLIDAIDNAKPQPLLSYWIKASGGAKKLARDIMNK